jgi:hypothetical protein
MLYQLIRRDTVWKDGWWCFALCAVLCLIPKIQSLDLGAVYGPLYVLCALFVAMPHRRATVFEATLPIPARTLFLARAVSVLGIIWLTAAVAVLAYTVSRGPDVPALRTVVTASFCTLGAALLLCFRLRYIAGPVWSLALVYFCGCFSFLAGHLHPFIPLACAATGVALLVFGWRAAPDSFQLPATRSAQPAPNGQAAAPATPWMPAIRSVISWHYLFWCLMTAALATTGSWLAAGFPFSMAWVSVRMQVRWLWTLPIRPRRLLVLYVAPALAFATFGYFLSLRIGRHPWPVPAAPVQALYVGGALAWLLLVLLICALLDWRPLIRQKRAITIAIVTVLTVVPLLGLLVFRSTHGNDPLHNLALRMAAAFPGNWVSAAVLVVIVLGVLWRALEKVVSQSEYADRPRRARAWE